MASETTETVMEKFYKRKHLNSESGPGQNSETDEGPRMNGGQKKGKTVTSSKYSTQRKLYLIFNVTPLCLVCVDKLGKHSVVLIKLKFSWWCVLGFLSIIILSLTKKRLKNPALNKDRYSLFLYNSS